MADSVSDPEEKEEKPVKRRGRPRKPRDEPVRNLFDGNKSSDEESVSDSDQRGHGGDDDDEDDAFDQPLINTFRPSASKLRSLKGVSQQGTSSQRKAPTASGKVKGFALTGLWFLSVCPFPDHSL